MADLIVVLILLALCGLAVFYIYKQKKKGAKCIGCPYANKCKNNNCSSIKKDS